MDKIVKVEVLLRDAPTIESGGKESKRVVETTVTPYDVKNVTDKSYVLTGQFTSRRNLVKTDFGVPKLAVHSHDYIKATIYCEPKDVEAWVVNLRHDILDKLVSIHKDIETSLKLFQN